MEDVWAATLLPGRALRAESDRVVAFIDAHRQRAFGVAFSIVGRADAAEDVAQEALVKAFQKLRGCPVDASVAWVSQIAARCAYDYLKNEARLNKSFAPTPTMRRHDEAICEREMVRSVLSQLPPAHRALLAMHVGEELTYKDMADSLQLPLGTISRKIASAKNAFKSKWEELWGTE